MMNNGAVHMVSTIIRNVMSYEAEANIAALYLNERGVVIIWNMLEEMGHTQPTFPLKTKNSTSKGIVSITIFQKYSNRMDTIFYWLHNW